MFGYSEKKLAKELGQAAKRINSAHQSTYHKDSRTVQISRVSESDEPPYSVYLGNLFNKVKDLKRSERVAVLTSFLSDCLNPKELKSDELIASLALRARTPFDLSLRQLMLASPHDRLKTVVYGTKQLLLELVIDNADSVTTVPPENLSDANISQNDAFKAAAARLVRESQTEQWHQQAPGLWLSVYEDDYDFARLVAAGAHARLPFSGTPIVFSPSHAVCLITDQADDTLLGQMTDMGNQLAESHRPFSQLLWSRTPDGEWLPWTPPPEAAGARSSRLQQIREEYSQYSDQKELFAKQLEATNEDSYAATYQAYERGDTLHSVCTYTLNLPSYLPKTDLVVLVDPNADEDNAVLGEITWSDFASLLGGDTLIEVKDLIPSRYRLTAALRPDQDADLRNNVTAF